MDAVELLAKLNKELKTCNAEIKLSETTLEDNKNKLSECKTKKEREIVTNCLEYFRYNIEMMKLRIVEINEEINSIENLAK